MLRFIVISLLAAAFGGQALARDLFNKRDAPDLPLLQPIPGDGSMRGYPLPPAFGQWLFAAAGTTYSTGTGSGVPLGRVSSIALQEKTFLATLDTRGNLEELSTVADWVDEPCKREDYLWKRSIGGKFRDINCAYVVHVVSFFAAPTGKYQQLLARTRDLGIDIPPTVIKAEFVRYSDRGRRLVYTFHLNPEVYGFPRDNETVWGASGWHKEFIARDPKKVEFIGNVSRWAEDLQNRLDRAFNHEPEAFLGMPSFMSYIAKEAPTPATAQQPTPVQGAIEVRLQQLKDLFEKKLITEQAYNEQVRKALDGQ